MHPPRSLPDTPGYTIVIERSHNASWYTFDHLQEQAPSLILGLVRVRSFLLAAATSLRGGVEEGGKE